jgi:hypothetical protein
MEYPFLDRNVVLMNWNLDNPIRETTTQLTFEPTPGFLKPCSTLCVGQQRKRRLEKQ